MFGKSKVTWVGDEMSEYIKLGIQNMDSLNIMVNLPLGK